MHALKKTQYRTCTALSHSNISTTQTISFGIVSVAQLVNVTDSAVLGGVIEVVSSNLARAINILQYLPAQQNYLFLHIYHFLPFVLFYLLFHCFVML